MVYFFVLSYGPLVGKIEKGGKSPIIASHSLSQLYRITIFCRARDNSYSLFGTTRTERTEKRSTGFLSPAPCAQGHGRTRKKMILMEMHIARNFLSNICYVHGHVLAF